MNNYKQQLKSLKNKINNMNNNNYKQQLKCLKNKINNIKSQEIINRNLNVIDAEEDDDNILNIAFDASLDQFKMLDIIDLTLDIINKNFSTI